MKFKYLLLNACLAPAIAFTQPSLKQSQPVGINNETNLTKPAMSVNTNRIPSQAGSTPIANQMIAKPLATEAAGSGGGSGLLIGNGSSMKAPNTAGSTNSSEMTVPQHAPIPVTPQLMDALTKATEKKGQVVSAAQAEYQQAVDKFKAYVTEHGGQITIISLPATNQWPPLWNYYITVPNELAIEVSNGIIPGWTRAADITVKTVSVYDTQTGEWVSVTVYIEHSRAKAALFAKSDIPLTTQTLEQAFAIAVYRGNVH